MATVQVNTVVTLFINSRVICNFCYSCDRIFWIKISACDDAGQTENVFIVDETYDLRLQLMIIYYYGSINLIKTVTKLLFATAHCDVIMCTL